VTAKPIKHYHARLQRTLAYIDAHLDEELSVDTLSGVAAFSRFHFHRQFTALFGIGVARYVQLARLKRASYRLAFRDNDPVVEIALESGYEGPEAFARAFKQRFGQSPSDFRNDPQLTSWHATYQALSETRTAHMKREWKHDDVRIVDFKETRVAAMEHRGDPATIWETVRRFIAWRKQTGIVPKVSATFQLLYDDPATTPPAEFRCDLCAATERDIMPNDAGMVVKTIPGGRCAVLRFTGSDDGLGDAAMFLYRDWLPNSGEETRDFPLYCQRLSFFPDVPEHEAVMDIFLALK
jgi:AraC family transcriptional regulator